MKTEEISFSGAQRSSNLISKKTGWKNSSKKGANHVVKTEHGTPNTGHLQKEIGPAEICSLLFGFLRPQGFFQGFCPGRSASQKAFELRTYGFPRRLSYSS